MKQLLTLLILFFAICPSGLWAQTRISAETQPGSFNIRKIVIPPILKVSDITFSDANNNDRIDGMEKCTLSFNIENSGKGPAVNMQMTVVNLSAVTGLDFRPKTSLETIKPGEKSNMSVPIEGTLSLTSGVAIFRINFQEALGFPPDPFEIKIETKAFQQPQIKMVDHQFLTDAGVVTLGKPVKIRTLIQNIGLGVADQVEVKFILPPQNVFPITDSYSALGTMNPGDTRSLDFEFLPNKIYESKTIPVKVQIDEKWGKYGQNSEVTTAVDARLQDASVTFVGKPDVLSPVIPEASLSSDVDKNIPFNPGKNPHRYALIIGNEDYTTYQKGLGSESNVAFAVADARSFSRYAENTLGIPKENLFVFENAISSVMKRELEKLTKIIQYENGKAEVIIYYAGHGFPDEITNEPYLIPVDITGSNVHDGIKLTSLYTELTRYPSSRITVFLDACFSGGGREAGLMAARSVRIKPREDTISGNLVVFTASSGDQSALPYRKVQHGIFTYYLLKTIQETKGKISYGQLFDQVKNQVELNAIKVNSKDQNPGLILSPDVAEAWKDWKLLE